MKIETTIHTNTSVTLTKQEAVEVIKKHIKETQGIDVEHVNFMFDAIETLDLTSIDCNVGKTEKK